MALLGRGEASRRWEITGEGCALKGYCGIPGPFSSSFLLSEHGLSTFALE